MEEATKHQYVNASLVIGCAPILALIWLACLGYTKNDIWSSDFVNITRSYALYSTGLCAAVFIAAAMASRRLAGAMYVIPFLALAWDADLGGNARAWLVLDGLAVVAVADIATRYQPKAWQLLRVVPVGLGIGWVKAITLMEFAERAVIDKHGSSSGKALWKEEIASKLSGDLWGAAFMQAVWLALVIIVLILATIEPSKLSELRRRYVGGGDSKAGTTPLVKCEDSEAAPHGHSKDL